MDDEDGLEQEPEVSPMSSSSMDFSDRILKQVGPAALLAANTQSFKNLRSPSASSKLRAQASVHVIKEEEDEEVVAVTDERQLSLTPVPSVPSVSPNELEKLLHSVGPATLAAASQSMERIIVTPSLAVKAGTGSGTPTHASPRLLNGINPTRREYIIRILRKSIPLVAKARREVIKKNAAYARLCILDAFQGRLSNGLANNSKKSTWIYTIFCIQTSTWLLNAVVIASVLHTLSVFFEPSEQCMAHWLFRLYQWSVVVLYAADIALKMSYEGVKEYFSHDWQQLYVINLILHVLDLSICGCTHFANPLRPVAGVLRARKGRKFFEVLKKMLPGMMHSLVPIVFFVVIVMGVTSVSFSALFPDFAEPSYTSYNWTFLVFTNDNFNRLLPTGTTALSYLLFFFPSIYVGQRFLLSLIIGDTYETFRSYVKKQLKKEKLKEIQGLTKAFAALDDRKCGSISDLVFKEALVALDPDLSEEAIALYFELLNGGTNGVNVLQFLSLRSVLNFKMTVNKPNRMFGGVFELSNAIQARLRGLYKRIVFPVPAFAVSPITFLWGWLQNQLDAVNIADIIVFSTAQSDTALHTIATYGADRFLELTAWASELWIFQYISNPLPIDMLAGVASGPLAGPLGALTLCQLISMFYILEFICRLVVHNGSISGVSQKNNIVALLFLAGAVGCIVTDLTSCATPAVLLSLRLMRCVRMANLNSDLQDFTAAIMDIIPSLSETFLFTFIVTYIFGTLGNLLFGGMDEWSSPLIAIVKAQKLTFMVNYLDSMEDVMLTQPLSIIYFVFYLILSLTVSNIALSIIIDLHGSVLDQKSKKSRQAQQQKLDLVWSRILGQARVRQLFAASSRQLNFKNVILSQFQSSDVRHFITSDEGNEVSQDDLKACQKYSSIDLMKFHTSLHASTADLNWEMDFLKALQDVDVHEEKCFLPGEVICTDASPATHAYILVQGTVVVQRVDGSSLFHPTTLFGMEVFQPGGRYGLTVKAEHDTKLLIVTQSDVMTKLDAQLTGSMLKMAFKSATAIDTAINENKRRKRFSVKAMNTGSF